MMINTSYTTSAVSASPPSSFHVIVQIGPDPTYRSVFVVHSHLICSQLISAIQQTIPPYAQTLVTALMNTKHELIPLHGQVAAYVHPNDLLIANIIRHPPPTAAINNHPYQQANTYTPYPTAQTPQMHYPYGVPQPRSLALVEASALPVPAPLPVPVIQPFTSQQINAVPAIEKATAAKTIASLPEPGKRRDRRKRVRKTRSIPYQSRRLTQTSISTQSPVIPVRSTTQPVGSVAVVSSNKIPASSLTASPAIPIKSIVGRVADHAIMDTDTDSEASDSSSIRSTQSWSSTDSSRKTDQHKRSKKDRARAVGDDEAVVAARLITQLSQTPAKRARSTLSSPATVHSSPGSKLSKLSLTTSSSSAGAAKNLSSSKSAEATSRITPALQKGQVKHASPNIVTIEAGAYGLNSSRRNEAITSKAGNKANSINNPARATASRSVPVPATIPAPSFSLDRLKTLTPQQAAVQRTPLVVPALGSNGRLRPESSSRRSRRGGNHRATAVSFHQPPQPYMAALALPAIPIPVK